MEKIPEAFISQLDDIINTAKSLSEQSKYGDLSDINGYEASKLLAKARAAVVRISGKDSVYSQQINEAVENYGPSRPITIPIFGGIAGALKEDILAGYLITLQELVHSELFADFLEMADHLLNEGYKDAAAVIAGSSLEVHLNQLCEKHDIDIKLTTAKGDFIPKKADRLNADLTKKGVFSKLDQKSITAWLDLRNKAAHGKYDEYAAQQVSLMITGVREFIIRIPA